MILVLLILPLILSVACSVVLFCYIRRMRRAADNALEVLSDA